MGELMKILALDMSSMTIGLCYDGQQFETIALKGDIAQRAMHAARMIHAWLLLWPDVDLVVIESPVARFASAIIPQARVSGAVLAQVATDGIAWVEVSPTAAKKLLAGRGDASKQMMIDAAPRGCTEHEADAYGLWLCGKQLKVESVAA
jgi:Holliday junction resolvasome RuvABC endonuclease subunit